MIMIFSSTRIEGLQGTYVVAGMATEVDVAHATVAYTDNERIRAMARKFNVEVRDFPKHPPSSDEPIEKKVIKVTAEAIVTKGDDVFEPLVLVGNAETITENTDAITATSTIEADILAGMTTPDLKKKWKISGKEVGSIRRKLKAK